MKERYSRFIENITPQKSDAELFEAVTARAEKNEKIKMKEKRILKKAVIVPVAAVTAVVLSVAGGAAVYGGFAYLRTGELTRSSEVAERIRTEVFSDSNEHIKMTVEEYVSDGMTAYATVKYEALDDRGREWISNINIDNNSLCLKPCSAEYGSAFAEISHSFGNFEFKELRTESERFFRIEMNCAADEYDGGIALVYAMGAANKETPMEKQTIKAKSYTLSGDGQASKYFTPTHLKISDLSYTLYGMQNGVYERWSNEDGSGVRRIIPDEVHADDIKLTIVNAGGEKRELQMGWGLCSAEPKEENFNTDLVILSGNYTKYDSDRNEWVNYSICSDDIAGIEINGVYYTLTEIE